VYPVLSIPVEYRTTLRRCKLVIPDRQNRIQGLPLKSDHQHTINSGCFIAKAISYNVLAKARKFVSLCHHKCLFGRLFRCLRLCYLVGRIYLGRPHIPFALLPTVLSTQIPPYLLWRHIDYAGII